MAYTGMTGRPWEVGSEFHWDDRYLGASSEPSNMYREGALFATARGAIEALADEAGLRGRSLHLPTYFCPEVTEHLAGIFKIQWYRDDPSRSAPDFDTLTVESGDLVLAVNYFGFRDSSPWESWVADHHDVLLVDDVSHDPSPHRIKTSPAHYVWASLRKTLPIPDGGWVSSPKGLKLPPAPEPAPSSPKLEAMFLKSLYLSGRRISKEAFRSLQIRGEDELAGAETNGGSVFTTEALSILDVSRLRRCKRENLHALLRSSAVRPADKSFVPLFESWPEEATPLGLVLLCNTEAIREGLREHLVGRNVFPAIHWSQSREFSAGDSEAEALSARILTIPCDFRYDISDIERLLSILESFKL